MASDGGLPRRHSGGEPAPFCNGAESPGWGLWWPWTFDAPLRACAPARGELVEPRTSPSTSSG